MTWDEGGGAETLAEIWQSCFPLGAKKNLLMSDPGNILDVYHRIRESHGIPFDPIREYDEWHLTVFDLPSFQKETILDIDSRRKESLIYLTRFGEPVWDKVRAASQKRGRLATFPVERACERLPKTASIHRLVEEVVVFRLADGQALGVDGGTTIVVFTYKGGVFRRECWEARHHGGAVWLRLLCAVEEALRFLPGSKFYP